MVRPRTLAIAGATVAGCTVVLGLLGLLGAGSSASSPEIPATTTTLAAPATTTAQATTTTSPPATTTTPPQRSTTLIAVPAGCTTPAPAQIVFIGQLVDRDDTTARYELRQVRAGAAGDLLRSNLLDVRYDADTKYLSVGNQYLVGAGLDSETNTLFSKVRSEQPLFGGNDIVDVGETDIECPVLEDPVRTLTVTGRSIDSGVLSELSDSQDRVLRAIVLPTAIAVGIIVALALVRWILTGAWRGAATAVDASRRQHQRNRWR